jgi:hypothetical protein
MEVMDSEVDGLPFDGVMTLSNFMGFLGKSPQKYPCYPHVIN